MLTNTLPLLYIMFFKHVVYWDKYKQILEINCRVDYTGRRYMTYGGYFQDDNDKCLVYQLDSKMCEMPYGCANVHELVLDYTWYGANAKVCEGIDIKRKFEYINNTTVTVYGSTEVACEDYVGVPLKVIQTTINFRIYDMFLPNWYSVLLSAGSSKSWYDLDSQWKHVRHIRIPKLIMVNSLKKVHMPYSPFLFVQLPFSINYTCGRRDRYTTNLNAENCGVLIPINFTHGICSDTLMRFDPLRCFNDYGIKLLSENYVQNKFLNTKPTGFFATVASEIIDAILYVIRPLVEDIIECIIVILDKMLVTFKSIVKDILPTFLDLLTEIIDVCVLLLDSIYVVLKKLLNLIVKLIKIIDRDIMLTELTVVIVLSGLRFGLFRSLLITIILIYLFGVKREEIDLRYIFDTL